jgi:hypothetical protein
VGSELLIELWRTNRPILALPLTGQFMTVSGDDGLEASITGAPELSRWQSYVIRPNSSFLDLLRDGEADIGIRFVSEGIGTVAIDRIQLVSDLNGMLLSAAAFGYFFDWFGSLFVPIAALLFAYTTVLAGSYYGEMAVTFLAPSWVRIYLCLYIAATFLGCVSTLSLVINFSDLMLGLMCLPNLVAIVLLLPRVRSLLEEYSGSALARPRIQSEEV